MQVFLACRTNNFYLFFSPHFCINYEVNYLWKGILRSNSPEFSRKTQHREPTTGVELQRSGGDVQRSGVDLQRQMVDQQQRAPRTLADPGAELALMRRLSSSEANWRNRDQVELI